MPNATVPMSFFLLGTILAEMEELVARIQAAYFIVQTDTEFLRKHDRICCVTLCMCWSRLSLLCEISMSPRLYYAMSLNKTVYINLLHTHYVASLSRRFFKYTHLKNPLPLFIWGTIHADNLKRISIRGIQEQEVRKEINRRGNIVDSIYRHVTSKIKWITE